MPNAPRTLQFSFAGGEMSPEMWSRYDDSRLRTGVARARNMLTHPRGSAARRPGLELVRACKSGATAARLIPFAFSRDQTAVVEMGVASRGYFRFHVDGGTLLHQKPADYIEPQGVTGWVTASDTISTAAAHGLTTGDPIIFTIEALQSVTVTITIDVINLTAHGFQNGEIIMFRTSDTMPSVGPSPAVGSDRLIAGRLYYVVNRTANSFQVALTRGGEPINFTGSGVGTLRVACMPGVGPVTSSTVADAILPNVTYYAIVTSATGLQIALTRADAEGGNQIDLASDGSVPTSGSVRVHYDYRNGSTAFFGGVARYCRRIPWGTAEGANFINFDDHDETGHAPGGLAEYWVDMPGTSSTVTFNTTTNVVNWTAHGLTDGDVIIFTTDGVLPTGITAGDVYYVRDGTTNSFAISATLAGATQELSGSPSGTHTAWANGFYEVPHDYPASALFEVNHAQSNDVLTLAHPDRPVTELQRRGATEWVLETVRFGSAVDAPISINVTAFSGEGQLVTAVTNATPARLTTAAEHLLAIGQRVQIDDVGDIPNGFYIVENTPGSTTFELKNFDDGARTGSGSTTVGSTSYVRPSDYSDELDVAYAVSALDSENRESPVSPEGSVRNNLLGTGARNTIRWAPVGGASRYRVYKKTNGLFGFIGEVDAPEVEFIDNNIGPDLSITPPFADESLRKDSVVTFDTDADTVLWADHGLEEGAPVTFWGDRLTAVDGALPPEIARLVTYFVANPAPDKFELRDAAGALVDMTLPGSPGAFSGVATAVAGNWPAAVTYFEQRRVFGGATLTPQDFTLTASGTESELSFNLPVKDSNRIRSRLAARERSQIRHAVPLGNLLLLANSAEFRVTPRDSDALTPASVAARAPTQVGVSGVAPVVVNNAVLFPAARGGHLRELGFAEGVGDYVTGDVSLRAAHLFENRQLVQLAYQKAPQQIVWAVTSAGTLLGLTYVPEQQVAGWHEHDTDGTFESCAVVSEGDEDRLYVVTLRGGTRYVERVAAQQFATEADAFFLDFAAAYSGAAVSRVFVPHLAGTAVSFVADGVQGTGTVDASGYLTLLSAATTVIVGQPYQSELTTLPLGMQVDAAVGVGRTKNVNAVFVRVRKSGAFQAGQIPEQLTDSEAPNAGTFLDKLVQVTTLGAWDLDGQFYIRKSDAQPLNVTGVTLEVAMGG